MNITAKLILNVSHHSSATKKLFHSQSPKTILNGISFAFLCYWKTSDLHLIVELYIILLKNHVRNHLKITFVEFCIHAGKDHQCFCRSFRNQTFTFISSKVVYFKKSRTTKFNCHWMFLIAVKQLDSRRYNWLCIL